MVEGTHTSRLALTQCVDSPSYSPFVPRSLMFSYSKGATSPAGIRYHAHVASWPRRRMCVRMSMNGSLFTAVIPLLFSSLVLHLTYFPPPTTRTVFFIRILSYTAQVSACFGSAFLLLGHHPVLFPSLSLARGTLLVTSHFTCQALHSRFTAGAAPIVLLLSPSQFSFLLLLRHRSRSRPWSC